MKKMKCWVVLASEDKIERTPNAHISIFSTEKAAKRFFEEWDEKLWPSGLGKWKKLHGVVPGTITY